MKINEKTAAATGAEGSARPPAPGGQRGHPRRGVSEATRAGGPAGPTEPGAQRGETPNET